MYPWFSLAMLVAEASQVMVLRSIKLSQGGMAALDESCLMVSEKITASWEAAGTMMAGGNGLSVIERYREHVAFNAGRLAAR